MTVLWIIVLLMAIVFMFIVTDDRKVNIKDFLTYLFFSIVFSMIFIAVLPIALIIALVEFILGGKK